MSQTIVSGQRVQPPVQASAAACVTASYRFGVSQDPDALIALTDGSDRVHLSVKSSDGLIDISISMNEAQLDRIANLIYVRDRVQSDNHNPECECGDCQQRAQLGDIGF